MYIQMRLTIRSAEKKDQNLIKRVSPASETPQAYRSCSRSIDFINTVLKTDRPNFIFWFDYSYHYQYHAAAEVYFCGITFKMEIVIPRAWFSVCNK